MTRAFGAESLPANRAGRLSGRQRRCLVRHAALPLGLALVALGLAALFAVGVRTDDAHEYALGWLLAAVYAGTVAAPELFDAVSGRLLVFEGALGLAKRRRGYALELDGQPAERVVVLFEDYLALTERGAEGGERHPKWQAGRLYVAPRSRHLMNAEERAA